MTSAVQVPAAQLVAPIVLSVPCAGPVTVLKAKLAAATLFGLVALSVIVLAVSSFVVTDWPAAIGRVTSRAPMSQTAVPSPLPSTGRLAPRWSVLSTGLAAQTLLSPASMAGLLASRAWVRVGPPLSARVGLRTVVKTLAGATVWSPVPPVGQPVPLPTR